MSNFRSRAFLDLAAWILPCQFEVPGVCSGVEGVFCHSNEGNDGKGVGIKAADCISAIGCPACHWWYDKGPASREEKREAFNRAFRKTVVLLWGMGLIGVAKPVTIDRAPPPQARERNRKSRCTRSPKTLPNNWTRERAEGSN